MAQISLRDALIRIKDGSSKTGAVNNAAGYVIGATTMVVDGFTGILNNGQTFTLAADTTIYTITAHTETAGNTTDITFTPGLVVAATDDQVITINPNSLDVKIGQGNLTYSEKRKMEYVLDRGRLSTVRQGDDEPMDVRLDFIWEFLTSSTGQPPTIEDALKQRGNASGWVTSSSDICEPYAVDIEIEYIPPCTGEERELITLNDFRYEDLAHDFKAGTVAVTGKCNVTQAAVVRAA